MVVWCMKREQEGEEERFLELDPVGFCRKKGEMMGFWVAVSWPDSRVMAAGEKY